MKKRTVLAALLVCAAASCSKLTKEDASTALALHYSGKDGNVECVANVDVFPGAPGDAFACADYKCRRCADALVRANVSEKSKVADDSYTYLHTTVRPNSGKLFLRCARKKGTVLTFSNKGRSGTMAVLETTEPDEAIEIAQGACGVSTPSRSEEMRRLRVERDDDSPTWRVID